MEQLNVLILDFYQKDALIEAIQSILQSRLNVAIQINQKTGGNNNPTLNRDNPFHGFSGFSPDVIFLIVQASLSAQGPVSVQDARKAWPETPIIGVIDVAEPDNISALLKLGLADFVTAPLRSSDLIPRLWRWVGSTHLEDTLIQALKQQLGLKQLIGEDPAFLSEIKKIPLVANCTASVLISGETGTGKELCARAIHHLSARASKPFVPVNCGAIPLDLVENELFGHERGAFTGASTTQIGLVQEADRGTLFLDEIDCLPLMAQAKLLRFLQEKEYRPLGSTKMRSADVRVIAATNIELEEALQNGKFRRDLYYRLNIIPLILPPLRGRKEDILPLARHFLAKYTAKFDKHVTAFSPGALQKILRYDWPGNVRELEHIVQRAVVLAQQPIIKETDILLATPHDMIYQRTFHEAKAKAISEFERSYIERSLLAHQGNITQAAQASNKDRRTFARLIRKYQIEVKRFRSSAS